MVINTTLKKKKRKDWRWPVAQPVLRREGEHVQEQVDSHATRRSLKVEAHKELLAAQAEARRARPGKSEVP